MANELQYEKSPYLLQHKDNPVNWLPWSEQAFSRARREDKPIFLSIGYSTCHWCHVMAGESFEDDSVAEKLNRHFVSVKVDREERPDVDSVYMAACMALLGSGGWPLTVLMTADQKPFWVGTYLRREMLLSLLEQVKNLWNDQREELLSSGEALTELLRREEELRPGIPRRELAEQAFGRYAAAFDRRWGGFGHAPKFPTPHNLLFLMEYARCSGESSAMEMAEQTMEAMYRGGIFDHVGGGFSRYATDEQWLVPHFEKMLYDNALLLYTYARAAQLSGCALYREVCRRTADYLLRELQAPEGGFYCAQDADSDGVEGRYYVFSRDELQKALGKEGAEVFCGYYGIREAGNFGDRSIPNLIETQSWEAEPEGMAGIRERLRQYRAQRCALHKDDKILTAWNGLAIAGLAKAAQVLGEDAYLHAAKRAAEFLNTHLQTEHGRLLARWRDGQAAFDGKLEDYAFLCWGLTELYAASFSPEYLQEALKWCRVMVEQFHDPGRGGYYPYANDAEQLLTRTKEVYDGAIPSGNAVAALVLARLARLSGDVQLQQLARQQLRYLSAVIGDAPQNHGFGMLALLEELWPGAELLCCAAEMPPELPAYLAGREAADQVVLLKLPHNARALADAAPFTAHYPIPERGAQYYLCRSGTCIRPVEHVQELNGKEKNPAPLPPG